MEIIAFSSGKGGTGKTLIATCLGYSLTKIGLRVLMIDADIATDGLSLYLLGPAGMEQAKKVPKGSTLTGILHQFKEQGNIQFTTLKIHRSRSDDHGVSYDAIISGKQLYGDRSESFPDDASMHPDRESYRGVMQTIFDSLRSKAEFDYVIVDTRGGFSSQSTDVSALADSYIVVTEADVTSFYQNRNLIQYIDQAASELDKKAVLRSIIVNKSTQFSVGTEDFNLDNLESSFRLQLESEFPIGYKDTHPLPLSIEALKVQKFQRIPIRHALDSDFSYAFFVAFHDILSVVTQPWTQEQVAEWNYLVDSVNLAIQKRNDDLLKAEQEEQEQHKELEKLRKDNAEYINRISSLEREITEIDDRYKRELERSDVLAAKLENKQESLAIQSELKSSAKPHRSWVPWIVALLSVGVIGTLSIFGSSFFPSHETQAPTNTIPATTETPLVPSATVTNQPINLTETQSPTETIATIVSTVNTSPSCPKFVVNPAASSNLVHFVADINFPTGSEIPPNQVFEKTWMVQNVGNETWDTYYTLNYAEGASFGFKPTFFSEIANPGDCIEITISLKAPEKPGTYKGNWVILDQKGERIYFDDENIPFLNVTIIVPH